MNKEYLVGKACNRFFKIAVHHQKVCLTHGNAELIARVNIVDGTVNGIGIAHDPGNPAEAGERRIIGVECKLYTVLFRIGHYGLQKIRVVFPQGIGRDFGIGFLEIRNIEFGYPCAAALGGIGRGAAPPNMCHPVEAERFDAYRAHMRQHGDDLLNGLVAFFVGALNMVVQLIRHRLKHNGGKAEGYIAVAKALPVREGGVIKPAVLG